MAGEVVKLMRRDNAHKDPAQRDTGLNCLMRLELWEECGTIGGEVPGGDLGCIRLRQQRSKDTAEHMHGIPPNVEQHDDARCDGFVRSHLSIILLRRGGLQNLPPSLIPQNRRQIAPMYHDVPRGIQRVRLNEVFQISSIGIKHFTKYILLA
jgi:hypothetical protein